MIEPFLLCAGKVSEDLASLSKKLVAGIESSEQMRNQCFKLQGDIERMRIATENPYQVSYHPGPRLNEKTNGHFTAGVPPPANERNREYLITMDVDKVHVVCVCVCVCVCMCTFHSGYICSVYDEPFVV